MKYLCLGYHEEKLFEQLSPRDRAVLGEELTAYEQHLRDAGHVIDARALEPARAATTLRFATGGKLTVTDGPFAETKEPLGGIMVLEAKDLNHAIQLMSQSPCMRLGGHMEIRPINEEPAQ
jgi:hypothetical protein